MGLAAGARSRRCWPVRVAQWRPEVVGIADPNAERAFRQALAALDPQLDVAVLAGADAATAVAAHPADVVLNGMTGSVGLEPTLAALAAGVRLALANKESLIAGGPLVVAAAAPGQIVPVDSEHSALAQCLLAGRAGEVRRLLLTASGGLFRRASAAELAQVTPAQALAHPTWDMGPVVTINSATMVNKGLEVIEAHLLFDVCFDRIDVVIHPQSMVHSMVEYVDGSTMAQVSPPDMRAADCAGHDMAAPSRRRGTRVRLDDPDGLAFRAVGRRSIPGRGTGQAGRSGQRNGAGGLQRRQRRMRCGLPAGKIGFTDIVATVSDVVDVHLGSDSGEGTAFVPGTDMRLADVQSAEDWARAAAIERMEAHD